MKFCFPVEDLDWGERQNVPVNRLPMCSVLYVPAMWNLFFPPDGSWGDGLRKQAACHRPRMGSELLRLLPPLPFPWGLEGLPPGEQDLGRGDQGGGVGKQEGEEDSIEEAASQVEDHQCSMNSLGVGGLPPVKQCPLFNWARCLKRFKLFLQQPACLLWNWGRQGQSLHLDWWPVGEGLGLRNRGIAVWEEHLRQRNIFWNYTKHKTHSTPLGLITIIIDASIKWLFFSSLFYFFHEFSSAPISSIDFALILRSSSVIRQNNNSNPIQQQLSKFEIKPT